MMAAENLASAAGGAAVYGAIQLGFWFLKRDRRSIDSAQERDGKERDLLRGELNQLRTEFNDWRAKTATREEVAAISAKLDEKFDDLYKRILDVWGKDQS